MRAWYIQVDFRGLLELGGMKEVGFEVTRVIRQEASSRQGHRKAKLRGGVCRAADGCKQREKA